MRYLWPYSFHYLNNYRPPLECFPYHTLSVTTYPDILHRPSLQARALAPATNNPLRHPVPPARLECRSRTLGAAHFLILHIMCAAPRLGPRPTHHLKRSYTDSLQSVASKLREPTLLFTKSTVETVSRLSLRCLHCAHLHRQLQ